jgi:hypothetical protein
MGNGVFHVMSGRMKLSRIFRTFDRHFDNNIGWAELRCTFDVSIGKAACEALECNAELGYKYSTFF